MALLDINGSLPDYLSPHGLAHLDALLAIAVSLVVSFSQSITQVLQRRYARRTSSSGRSVFIGISTLFNITGALVLIFFAPIIIVAPLTTTALIWDAIVTRMFLKTPFSYQRMLGSVLIATGSMAIWLCYVIYLERSDTSPMGVVNHLPLISYAKLGGTSFALVAVSWCVRKPKQPSTEAAVNESSTLLPSQLEPNEKPSSPTPVFLSASSAFHGMLSSVCLILTKELLATNKRDGRSWHLIACLFTIVPFGFLQLQFSDWLRRLFDDAASRRAYISFFVSSALFNSLAYLRHFSEAEWSFLLVVASAYLLIVPGVGLMIFEFPVAFRGYRRIYSEQMDNEHSLNGPVVKSSPNGQAIHILIAGQPSSEPSSSSKAQPKNLPHPPQASSQSQQPKTPVTVIGIPSISIENDRLEIGSSESTSTRTYTPIKVLGDGAFGTVWLCDWHGLLPPNTPLPAMQCGPCVRPEWAGKRLVAVKRLKRLLEGGWNKCEKLRELRILRAIPLHPNIIPLYDFFWLPTTMESYIVFEPMEGSLYHLIKARKGRPLAGGFVSSIFRQIVSGLDHIHTWGYFHRDMKPENVLVTTIGLHDYVPVSPIAPPNAPPEKDVVAIIKIADFGLAREIKSKPPYSEYVSCRWYRAPEVLLLGRNYSTPVDMWALGTIMAELVNLRPLFPGSGQVDQVARICEVLGDPSADYGLDSHGFPLGGGKWTRGIKLARAVGFSFPKMHPKDMFSLFDETVPISLIQLIGQLLKYDPVKRLTAKQCLEHRYLLETTDPQLSISVQSLEYPQDSPLSPSLASQSPSSLPPSQHNGLPPVEVPQQASNFRRENPPDIVSSLDLSPVVDPPSPPDDLGNLDKKEAQRARREAEKQRRAVMEKAQREKARAIMLKRMQLMQKVTSDDINNA